MKTYNELKKDFFASLQIKGRNAASSARLMEGAWAQHMEQIVCKKAKGVFSNGLVTGAPSNFDFPTPTTEPLRVSSTHAAIPTVGGGVVLKERATYEDMIPASVAVENSPKDWVAIMIDEQLVAVTVQEAFERGLHEVEMPRKRGRPQKPADERATERTEIRMTLDEKRRYVALGGQEGFRKYLRESELPK